MTKPIEGWVVQGLDVAASDHANWRCPEQGPEFIVWCMSREDFIAGAKWQANQSPEIADAIRKERERIYSELQPHIGEYSYSETEDGYREYSVPSDRCLRGIIFGDEK